MARFVNGRWVNNSSDKRKAVEEAGGIFNEDIEDDYVQGDVFYVDEITINVEPTVYEAEIISDEDEYQSPKTNKSQQPRNFVENLIGKYKKADGTESSQRSGWFD